MISYNDIRKWFVRTGALAVLFGFVLPSMLVSCSGLAGMPQASVSISLNDLAGENNMPLLYLVPLGALITAVLSFLPASVGLQPKINLLSQCLGVGLGLLSMIGAAISLSSDMNQAGFDVSPDYGMFVLLGGYTLAALGLVTQLFLPGQPVYFAGPATVKAHPATPPSAQPPTAALPYGGAPGSPQSVSQGNASGACLRVVKSRVSQGTISLSDQFTIGRSSENSLYLPDTGVSRRHALLRYAQGVWFIQDQGSAAGVQVNNKPVRAARLNNDDRIQIGENMFEFNC